MCLGDIESHVNDSERDASLRILSDPQRRRVVRRLVEATDGEATVDKLVDDLLDEDAQREPELASTRSELAIQLYHVHLPKLAAHDVVAFDPETNAVTARNTEAVTSVLESFPRETTPMDV
jgi:DNA-binding transcriptional ArsR family regulator